MLAAKMASLIRWLLVLPAAVLGYVFTSGLLGIMGVWYVNGGLLALVVSIFTATIPYWIVLQIRAFDPAAVIYLAQGVFAPAVAIYAGALVAPAHRFGTAVALFGILLVLVGGSLVAEVYLNASSDPGAHPLGLVIAGAVLGLIGAGIYVATLYESRSTVEAQPS